MITFSVPGTPIPQGSKQAFTNGTKTWLVEANKEIYAWREKIAKSATIAMELHRQKPLEGAVSLEIDFIMPRPKTVTRARHTVKPDLDKLIRAVNDAITGICFVDDSRVVRINAAKNYERFGTPGVIITLHSLDNDSITVSAASAFHEQYLGK
jgi:crossover junction endodeoxyribonuclease RusA